MANNVHHDLEIGSSGTITPTSTNSDFTKQVKWYKMTSREKFLVRYFQMFLTIILLLISISMIIGAIFIKQDSIQALIIGSGINLIAFVGGAWFANKSKLTERV